MSIEVNGIQTNAISQYPKVSQVEEKKEHNVAEKKKTYDEYISTKKEEKEPSGLYSLTQDEDGNRRIVFDNAEKTQNSFSKVNSVDDGKKPETCTGNTDAVDREIEKLKKEKNQVEQQLQQQDIEENKRKELQQQLNQIENELSQKDNDAYRRQNSVFSNGQ